MKRNILSILIIVMMAIGLTGCGSDNVADKGKKQGNTAVLESDHLKVDGIYVDESFKDENLALVYMFYTVKAKDANIELASSSSTLKVNGTNSYEGVVDSKFIPKYTNYYYGTVIKKIYVGKEYKMCSTFKIAKGELSEPKEVTINNFEISDLDKIKFKTDDIKKMESLEKISEDLDSSTFQTKYDELQDKVADVDSSTVNKVKNDLNGYYFDFYVNVGTKLAKYKIEFDSPNKFTVSTTMGISNSGTYDVKKSALILNYKTGLTNTLYYSYEDGDITLVNTNEAFGTLVEYDPMGE